MNELLLTFESATARLERIIQRLIILCIVLFVAFFIAVCGLLYLTTAYETVEVEQEVTTENGIALVSGTGDVNYDN